MTTPLTSWICDTCGDEITEPGKALVIWRTDDGSRGRDFRIVHKSMEGRHCDPTAAAGFRQNTELSNFLGPNGLAYALSLLSLGPIMGHADVQVADFDGFVDLVRRTQTPWYEEARPHWQTEHTHSTGWQTPTRFTHTCPTSWSGSRSRNSGKSQRPPSP